MKHKSKVAFQRSQVRRHWATGLLLGALFLGGAMEGASAEQRIYLFHNPTWIGRVNLTGTNYDCCHSWIGHGEEHSFANPVDWLGGWLYVSISVAVVNPHQILTGR